MREEGDGLKVFVDDVEVPVRVGNDHHTLLAYNGGRRRRKHKNNTSCVLLKSSRIIRHLDHMTVV